MHEAGLRRVSSTEAGSRPSIWWLPFQAWTWPRPTPRISSWPNPAISPRHRCGAALPKDRDACRFLLESTGGEGLLFLNDDTVVTPYTRQLLREDLAMIGRQRQRLGLVGLRSNFVSGIKRLSARPAG